MISVFEIEVTGWAKYTSSSATCSAPSPTPGSGLPMPTNCRRTRVASCIGHCAPLCADHISHLAQANKRHVRESRPRPPLTRQSPPAAWTAVPPRHTHVPEPGPRHPPPQQAARFRLAGYLAVHSRARVQRQQGARGTPTGGLLRQVQPHPLVHDQDRDLGVEAGALTEAPPVPMGRARMRATPA